VLLILAEPDDAVAAAVGGRLRATGRPARWWTPLDLATARWTHRPGGSTVVTTAAGRIDLATASGVLNRLRWLPPVGFRAQADREYAAMERQALLFSVLAGFRVPVVNPVQPPALAAPVLPVAGWLALAARCGLPVQQLVAATDGRRWPAPAPGRSAAGWRGVFEPVLEGVGAAAEPDWPATLPVGRRPVVWAEPVAPAPGAVVVGRQVFGAAGPLAEGMLALSAAARAPVLQVQLGLAADGRRVVIGAEPRPARLPDEAVAALIGLVQP
jgi:hypothetical protein